MVRSERRKALWQMKSFVQERNMALFSLDKERILAYLKKYQGDIEEESRPENDEIFWASIYKAILQITSAPPELRDKSERWLREHGYRTAIGFPM